MRDFNSNLVDDDTYSKLQSRAPLGSGGVSLKNLNLGSHDGQIELRDTIMGECKLLKPIALPKLSKFPTRTKSTIGDKKISTHDMFGDEFIDSHLKFRESRVDLMWDTRRKLLELHFDGNQLIMYMQNGATIMDFD
ncbi:hypothetical protein V866_001324 [Kwoniella sp. B9012]